MRLLAVDEDDGITECEITSEIDEFLEAVKGACDNDYTVVNFLEDARKMSEVVMSLVDLVEEGTLSCDDPEGLQYQKELAEESLVTVETLRKRAAELNLL